MCDLLGICFNEPVDIHVSFENFVFKDIRNPDGCGVGWFEGKAEVFKDELSASESTILKRVKEKNPRSTIFISHVRAMSHGERSYRNTHPFLRTYEGRHYLFAHNGTICDFPEEPARVVFNPEGETDSEKLFCYILNQMASQDIKMLDGFDKFEWLQQTLSAVNNQWESNTMNVLLSDGQRLFCYSDKSGHNKLSYIRRQPPFGRVKLLDRSKGTGTDCFIELKPVKGPTEQGYLIATTKRTGAPTDEEWKEIPEGQLWVFENGKRVCGGV